MSKSGAGFARRKRHLRSHSAPASAENKVKKGDAVAADPLRKGSQLAADNNGGKILKLGRG